MDICPLSGNPCNLPKTHQITDIVDGKIDKKHLCQRCVQAYFNDNADTPMPPPQAVTQKTGADDPASPGDMLKYMLEFMQFAFGSKKKKIKPSEEKTCPDCGATINFIMETGKLGCPTCWEVFSEELHPVLDSHQEDVQHVGKIPKSKKTPVSEDQRLKIKVYKDDLESKLHEAVLLEKFEDAAVYRDKIKEVEGVSERMASLEKLMSEAVENDDFERAAEYKGKIDHMVQQFVEGLN